MRYFVYNKLIEWGWPEQNAFRQVELYAQGVRDHQISDDTIMAVEIYCYE